MHPTVRVSIAGNGAGLGRIAPKGSGQRYRKEHRAVGWVEGGYPLARSCHKIRPKPNAKNSNWTWRESCVRCWVSRGRMALPAGSRNECRKRQAKTRRALPSLQFFALHFTQPTTRSKIWKYSFLNRWRAHPYPWIFLASARRHRQGRGFGRKRWRRKSALPALRRGAA